jgi:hypothetical protein
VHRVASDALKTGRGTIVFLAWMREVQIEPDISLITLTVELRVTQQWNIRQNVT